MLSTRQTTERGCRNSTAAASAWWKCLLLLTIVQVISAADFYKLLGISRDATLKEIKKAYRQKSLEYHPDKNKEEGASERFAEINYAYEVLSDQEKRDIYNRHGEEGLKRHEQRGGGGGGGGFDDIFEQMFNFGGGGRRRGNQEQTTPSVEIPLHLTLNELYSGKTLEVKYVRQVLCLQWEMCVKQAPECHGPGVRVIRQQLAPGFVQTVQQADEKCVAQGKMWNPNCKACPERTQSESIDLTIEVAAGLRVGERITFEGVTDERPGFKPGDLHFVIFEEPHPDYHRDRDDLFKTMEIPLVDALTGFSITLTHLDGEQFTVDVNEVTDCDHVLRVHGKGMPRRNGRGFGDMYLTFEVDFPDELTVAQKEAIRSILGDGSTSDKNEEL
jgi:DnaJ-class molecular chaperone